MTDLYHDGNRQLQDTFDTRRLADRLKETIVHDRFTELDREFIERVPMFFLATVDAQGHANCSYKGGAPGFVHVVDDNTLAFPNYDGNGMYLSTGNIAQTHEVGMLFIDFENRWRMRVNGVANIDFDDPLREAYPETQFVVRVQAREIFANCPRYIHQMAFVEQSRFVPQEDCKTPVPRWKTGDWIADTLPTTDPARDPSREVLDR
ncbi:MAG: pyridoxamine 5'-phosphate oxidase family protein [Dehalococcoidia bacterium]|nr:MAG: pyridoxamine 5'-phosphate oxidase family protein [Dehalococcoidia bacterium]